MIMNQQVIPSATFRITTHFRRFSSIYEAKSLRLRKPDADALDLIGFPAVPRRVFIRHRDFISLIARVFAHTIPRHGPAALSAGVTTCGLFALPTPQCG